MTEARLPPCDQQAERTLLGELLRCNDTIGDVLQVLRAEDFYADANQRLFRAIVGLYDQGKRADLVTVADAIKAAGDMENVGGYGYLAELWNEAGTGHLAMQHAEIVRDKSLLRQLQHVATEILRDVADGPAAPAQDVVEQAERRVFEVAQAGLAGGTVLLAEAVNAAYDRLDARIGKTDGEKGTLPTGWPELDLITAGLQNSELTICGARPSTGKTAWALGLARNVAIDQGEPVFVSSLEQSRVELAERLLCCQANVDSHRMRHGWLHKEEQDRVLEAGDRLRAAKFFIDDHPNQTALRIAANARRLKLRHGIRLVVVDYLQLVQPDNRRESREQQVAGISRRLKLLARELAIPVVCLCQLNRASEQRGDGRPRLSDLRDSGAIEQDGDVVLLMHRPKEDESLVEMIVAKQRNGPTGVVGLDYRRAYMRFESLSNDPEIPA